MNLNPRPLPGYVSIERPAFMALLKADFDCFDKHGNPMSASKFWLMTADLGGIAWKTKPTAILPQRQNWCGQ